MAFRFFILVCLAFATGSAYQNVNNGNSVITSPGDVGSDGMGNREFQNQFNHGILDRLLRGKKMKVSVEENRRLTYEQDEECNSCNQPTQSPTTEAPLPPGPILTRYGSYTIFVPCSAQWNQILYTGLSATSPLPITWHGTLQSSSDVSDVNQANVFVVGPDSNGNYSPAAAQPLGTVYQTYEVWVTDSLGQRSTSVFITFEIQSGDSCGSTTSSTTWTTDTTMAEETTIATVTPVSSCDPCTGVGGSVDCKDCFVCEFINGGVCQP